MKKLFLISYFILYNSMFAQQIVLSSDSLLIISHYDEGYTGNSEYALYDSLWLYNTGDAELIIDSIKTQKGYSYRLKVEFKDSIEYYIIYNWEHLVSFSLPAQDSAKLIFADPDLCPICKTQNDVYMFEDTLFFYSNSITTGIKEVFVTGDGTSDVEINNNYENFSLFQNFPNPFNPSTEIKFSVPKDEFVVLKVFDMLGKEIVELVNKQKSAGTYSISFNASNLSSGIYFYSISAGKFNQVKKMILIR